MINVINFHVTNRCNYNCIYCFGKFEGQEDPSLEDAKLVVDKIAEYFAEKGIRDGRINLAGGEPMLYKYLDELIEYISSRGIAVSIVTNGSCLTSERIRAWRGRVSCIGISIDSLDSATNLKIGRTCGERTIGLSRLEELAEVIRECDIELKINTVVSGLNIREDLTELYRVTLPRKVKLLQMHLVDGINGAAEHYAISREEFDGYCGRYEGCESVIVKEPCGDMENSYLMINPAGELQINDRGRYEVYGNLRRYSLSELLAKAPLDHERFMLRYTKGSQE